MATQQVVQTQTKRNESESTLSSRPVTTNGVFTYYTGPTPEVDDTSMLVGRNPHLEVRTEPVLDLRSLPQPLSAYTHEEDGFQVMYKTSNTSLEGDVYSHDYIQQVYRPELDAFLKKKLGLRLCFLWGHLVRDIPRSEHTKPGEPASYPTASGTTAFHLAHCDFSPRGCRAFLRAKGTPDYFKILNNSYISAEDQAEFFRMRKEIIAAEEAAMRKAGIDPAAERDGKGGHWDWDGKGYEGPRWGVGTIWQPLEQVKRDPVAISLSPDKNVKWTSLMRKYHQLGYGAMGEFYFENMLVHPDPPQKWAYISEQQPEEVYFIKFFDTKAVQEGDGNMKSMRSHGAFHILGTENLPPRRSIETKVLFMY